MRFSLSTPGLALALFLATAGAPAALAQVGSPAKVNWQNSSETTVIAFEIADGEEKFHSAAAPGTKGTIDAKVGQRFVFKDPAAEDDAPAVVDLTVRKGSHTVEVGPSKGLIVCDKDDVPALEIRFVSSFQWIYDDHDTGSVKDCSIWRVQDSAMPKGFNAFGHLMITSKGSGADPSGRIAFPVVRDISPNKDAVAMAVQCHGMWNDSGSGGTHDVSIYALEAPKGYKPLGGMIISSLYGTNDATSFACLREDLTDTGVIGVELWTEYGAGADRYFRAYAVEAPQIQDGFMRMAPGCFIPLTSPFGGISEHAPTAPGDGFYNDTTKPDLRFANVMKFRLPFTDTFSASVLTTLPKTTEGFPEKRDRTQWKLSNSVAVPFTQVRDLLHDLAYQMEHPWYRAEKYVCWQAFDPTPGANAEVTKLSFTNTVGIEQGREESFSMTTGIKVKTEVGGEDKLSGFKASMSYEFSLELGMETTEWSTLKTTTSQSESFELKPGTNVVWWKPVYKYVLRRQDGSEVNPAAFVWGEMAKRMVYTDAEAALRFVNYGDLYRDQ